MNRLVMQIIVCLINSYVQELHIVLFKPIHYKFQILVGLIELDN